MARDLGLFLEMILGVLVGATIFGMVFKGLKGDKMIENAILFFDLGAYGTLGILLILIFVMGFFLEWVEISFIVLPLLLESSAKKQGQTDNTNLCFCEQEIGRAHV